MPRGRRSNPDCAQRCVDGVDGEQMRAASECMRPMGQEVEGEMSVVNNLSFTFALPAPSSTGRLHFCCDTAYTTLRSQRKQKHVDSLLPTNSAQSSSPQQHKTSIEPSPGHLTVASSLQPQLVCR